MKIFFAKIFFSINLVLGCSPQSSPSVNECDNNWSYLKYRVRLAPQNAIFLFNDACNGELTAQLQLKKTNETIRFGITNIHFNNSGSFLMGFVFNVNQTSFKFSNLSPFLWKFQSYETVIEDLVSISVINFKIPLCLAKFPPKFDIFLTLESPSNAFTKYYTLSSKLTNIITQETKEQCD